MANPFGVEARDGRFCLGYVCGFESESDSESESLVSLVRYGNDDDDDDEGGWNDITMR